MAKKLRIIAAAFVAFVSLSAAFGTAGASYFPDTVGTFKWYYSPVYNEVWQMDSKDSPSSSGKKVAEFPSSGRSGLEWMALPNGDTLLKSDGPMDSNTFRKTVYVDRYSNGVTTNLLTVPDFGGNLFVTRDFSPVWADGTFAVGYMVPSTNENGFYMFRPDGTKSKVIVPNSVQWTEITSGSAKISKSGRYAIALNMTTQTFAVVDLSNGTMSDTGIGLSVDMVKSYWWETDIAYFDTKTMNGPNRTKRILSHDPSTGQTLVLASISSTGDRYQDIHGIFFPSHGKLLYKLNNDAWNPVTMRDIATGTDTVLPIYFGFPGMQANGHELETRLVSGDYAVLKTSPLSDPYIPEVAAINLSDPSLSVFLFQAPGNEIKNIPETSDLTVNRMVLGAGQIGLPPSAPAISSFSVLEGGTVNATFSATGWIMYGMTGLPAGLAYAGNAITGTVSAPAGTYVVSTSASDGTLSSTGTFTITVTRAPAYAPNTVSFSWYTDFGGILKSVSVLSPSGTALADLQALGVSGLPPAGRENVSWTSSPDGTFYVLSSDIEGVSPRYHHLEKIQSGALVAFAEIPWFQGNIILTNIHFYRDGSFSAQYDDWGINDSGRYYFSPDGSYRKISGKNTMTVNGTSLMASVYDVSPDGEKTIRTGTDPLMTVYVHNLTTGTLVQIGTMMPPNVDIARFDSNGDIGITTSWMGAQNNVKSFRKVDGTTGAVSATTTVTAPAGIMPTTVYVPSKNKVVYRLGMMANLPVYVKDTVTGTVAEVPFADFNFDMVPDMSVDRIAIGDYLVVTAIVGSGLPPYEQKTIGINLNDPSLSTWLFPLAGFLSNPIADRVINPSFASAPADTVPPDVPTVTGISEAGSYTGSASASWTEVAGVTYAATIDGVPYARGSSYSSVGSHVFGITAMKTSNGLATDLFVSFSVTAAAPWTVAVVAENPPAECEADDANAGLSCDSSGNLVVDSCVEPDAGYNDKVFMYRSSSLTAGEFKLITSESDTSQWKQIGGTVKIAGTVSDEGVSKRLSSINPSSISGGKAKFEAFVSTAETDGTLVREGINGNLGRTVIKNTSGTDVLQFGTRSALFNESMKNIMFNYVLERMSGQPVEFVAKGCSGAWDSQISANVVGIIDGDNGSINFLKTNLEVRDAYK